MAWGFKKRIRIAPGLHVNIGKTGVSARAGNRFGGVTAGTSGARASANIPGTGLSVRKDLGKGAKSEPADATQRPAHRSRSRFGNIVFLTLIVIAGGATGVFLVEVF